MALMQTMYASHAWLCILWGLSPPQNETLAVLGHGQSIGVGLTTTGTKPVTARNALHRRRQTIHVPTVGAIVTEQHVPATRRFMTDLAGLVNIPSCESRVLPEVNIGIVARGTVLNVLLNSLFIAAL